MNTEQFERVIDEQLNACVSTLSVKAKEYATSDRLHNFKVAGELQDCTPIRALGGMMAKHTVSVYDLIKEHDEGSTVELAMWNEKIGDSINYLLLLKALVVEHMEEERRAMRVGVCDE